MQKIIVMVKMLVCLSNKWSSLLKLSSVQTDAFFQCVDDESIVYRATSGYDSQVLFYTKTRCLPVSIWVFPPKASKQSNGISDFGVDIVRTISWNMQFFKVKCIDFVILSQFTIGIPTPKLSTFRDIVLLDPCDTCQFTFAKMGKKNASISTKTKRVKKILILT